MRSPAFVENSKASPFSLTSNRAAPPVEFNCGLRNAAVIAPSLVLKIDSQRVNRLGSGRTSPCHTPLAICCRRTGVA